ncbi:MAG TPA: AI-2E family transporter [Burkholderiaceae bacterium]|nr:AI-2E family transporter [Burkholderiaceae bacterium]
MPSIQANFDNLLRFGGAAIVVVGIFMVLQPFLSAMVFAGVLAIATWPLFERLRKTVGGNSTLAATTMLIAILVLVIIPITFLSAAAADKVPAVVELVKGWTKDGLHTPEALKSVPLVGERLFNQIESLLADRAQLASLLQKALEPAGRLSIAFVRVLGDGILQLLLVTFIVFFYYRDGDRIVGVLRQVSDRISGKLSSEVLTIVTGTTRSVFIGIVGTAAAQSIVALIGFLIAGVPAAFMLAIATFVLSVVPMGPVLIWGAAAIWLYLQGEPGWAIFMVIWGAVVISSIDNFLKPILIARGSTLSLGMIFLGVLGGVLAFGFIGVILGPVLLALGLALGRAWVSSREARVTDVDSVAAAAAPPPSEVARKT